MHGHGPAWTVHKNACSRLPVHPVPLPLPFFASAGAGFDSESETENGTPSDTGAVLQAPPAAVFPQDEDASVAVLFVADTAFDCEEGDGVPGWPSGEE